MPLAYTTNLCPNLTNDIDGANSVLFQPSQRVSTVYPSSNELLDSIMPKDYEFCGCLTLDMFKKYGRDHVLKATGESFFVEYK